MGRPPLGAAAMTAAQREQKRRATASTRLAEAYAALIEATDNLRHGDRGWFQRKHSAVLTRAYAAQKKGE